MLELATRFRAAEPGAGAKTRLTKSKMKHAASSGWHVLWPDDRS